MAHYFESDCIRVKVYHLVDNHYEELKLVGFGTEPGTNEFNVIVKFASKD